MSSTPPRTTLDRTPAPREALHLPPLDPFGQCPACGIPRGMSEKLPLAFCDGGNPEHPCNLGGWTQHLHRGCLFCNFQFAVCLPDVETPLTALEIRELRHVLEGIKLP